MPSQNEACAFQMVELVELQIPPRLRSLRCEALSPLILACISFRSSMGLARGFFPTAALPNFVDCPVPRIFEALGQAAVFDAGRPNSKTSRTAAQRLTAEWQGVRAET